jgi:hypothetical protein
MATVYYVYADIDAGAKSTMGGFKALGGQP